MHVLVSSTFSASRLAADGGDADDGAAAARGGSAGIPELVNLGKFIIDHSPVIRPYDR